MKQTVTAFWQTRNAKWFDAGANSSGRMEALRRVATLAQPALSQAGTTSIDLGCGTGLFAAIVGVRSLIGVDVSEVLLVAARERMDTVVHQDIFAFQGAACSMDNIVSLFQYLRQLRKTEGGLRDVNTAQAGDPVENLA